jgi:hypothetical protein
LSSSATHPAQDNTASDGQSREAADLLAIERGENDGMIVHKSASLNVHNSKDLNAITTG